MKKLHLNILTHITCQIKVNMCLKNKYARQIKTETVVKEVNNTISNTA